MKITFSTLSSGYNLNNCNNARLKTQDDVKSNFKKKNSKSILNALDTMAFCKKSEISFCRRRKGVQSIIRRIMNATKTADESKVENVSTYVALAKKSPKSFAELCGGYTLERTVAVLTTGDESKNIPTPACELAWNKEGANILSELVKPLDSEQKIEILTKVCCDGFAPIHILSGRKETAEILPQITKSLDSEQIVELLTLPSRYNATSYFSLASDKETAKILSEITKSLSSEQKDILAENYQNMCSSHQ